MDCIFCKIINKEMESKVFYENEHTLAFLDIFPNSDGHSLVIPKKHFENYEQTDDFYLQEVAKTKKIVAKMLREKLNAKGMNYVSNQGSEAFQMVFHYHEHIIPKFVKEQGYGFKINNKPEYLSDIDKIYKKLK
ncbi:HIT family protein [Spiroplasma cantharicola]|uniref:Histidine triad protein n=1 Tax=Spiroplasma cantharicola TaxID=362837 RepID=A0A0M4JK65_9MOLU|nr:HIT family protein [Spiroplasma cantharicola]ALD66711.1 histidine triad protein [Spiroplasma cantharicola]